GGDGGRHQHQRRSRIAGAESACRDRVAPTARRRPSHHQSGEARHTRERGKKRIAPVGKCQRPGGGRGPLWPRLAVALCMTANWIEETTMNKFLLATAAFTLIVTAAPSYAQTTKNQLIGSWKVFSLKATAG